jgi:hypothetical protein
LCLLEIAHHLGHLLLIDREHFFLDGIQSSIVTGLAFHYMGKDL